MKHLLSILFLACVCAGSFAQTPYDSFAPETSRPILELPEPEPSPDTCFAIDLRASRQSNQRITLSVRHVEKNEYGDGTYCDASDIKVI